MIPLFCGVSRVVKIIEVEAKWCLPGALGQRNEECCLIGIEFVFYKMKNF